MRVLIVDDEHLARDRLSRMVTALANYEIVGEAANGLQAIEVAQREHPEVVLLDIRMPGMDGLEAARHLASLEEPPAVIFCTAYEEHAIEAFEVQAVGYLLKPVRSEKLAEAMASGQRLNKAQLLALSQPAGSRRTHISARTRRGIELVPIEDVRYFQADQKYVTVLHIGGELIIDEPLRELEDEFGEMFLRVHRNALVAVRHIEGLERGTDGHYRIRLRGADASLDISRRHVAAVRRLVKRL